MDSPLSKPKGPPASTTHRSIGDDVVDVVVRRLNKLCRQATFEFTLTVGSTVIENLYGGDLRLWRSRDPTKAVSLRRLARHPQLPMSPTALYRCVAIYELCERLDIRHWRHVSASHLRLVLPLEHEDQAQLLRLAEANMWPVRRLDEEIAATLDKSAARGGPRRRSRLSEATASVGKSLDAIERYLNPSVAHSEASPDSVRDAITCLRRAGDVCAKLEQRFGGPLSGEGVSLGARAPSRGAPQARSRRP